MGTQIGVSMKEKYTTPEMEIIRFECEDVITASGAGIEAYAANELRLLESGYLESIDSNQWSS